MRTVSLRDKDLQYSALSYYWGAPPARDTLKPIIINGHRILLRPSLHAFLCTLKNECSSLMFWLDVVCINQNSNEERSSQVAMMRDIYASADRVYVWLGQGDADSEYAFAQIDVISTGQTLQRPYMFVETLEQLFHRPYWTRMWVIQEFAVARSLIMVCGRSTVP